MSGGDGVRGWGGGLGKTTVSDSTREEEVGVMQSSGAGLSLRSTRRRSGSLDFRVSTWRGRGGDVVAMGYSTAVGQLSPDTRS